MSTESARAIVSVGRPREFDINEALDKALAVFLQKGFEGASLPDLTKAMGINRPSLYAAYGNKEGLFRKALERYVEQGLVRLQAALSAPTAYEAVRTIFMSVVEKSGCSDARGCLLVQGALACGDEAQGVRLELAARRQQVEVIFRQRFERAIAEGDLPAGTSPTNLAGFVATVLQGMSVQSSGGASREALLGIAEMALKAFPR